MGKNIHESFSKAAAQTKIFTALGDGSVNAPPYFDNSAQHPLLDDNGDKIGTNNLMEIDNNYVQRNENDGVLSNNITIGVSSLTMNDPGDVVITEVSDQIFLGVDETTTDKIWAKVSKNERLLTLWIEIKPPSFVPNAVGTGQVEMDLPRIIKSRHDTPTDRYYWDPETLENAFDIPGTYHIYYFAKDTDSKNVSPIKESIVYKASSVNHPPQSFDMLTPRDGLKMTSHGVLAACASAPTPECYTMFTWEYTTDPDDDALTYNLLIKRDNQDFSNPDDILKITGLTANCAPVVLNDDWNNSTVYWMVQAIDKYGAVSETNIRSFFIDNAHNPTNGSIWGRVYDASSKELLKYVKISVNRKMLLSNFKGEYHSAFRPGYYDMEASLDGYYPVSKSSVIILPDRNHQEDFVLERIPAQPPVIGDIPSQTITEGMLFSDINLDNFIEDSDTEDEDITWTVSGQKDLTVEIKWNRMVEISIPHENWYGSETITFKAEDPTGESDTMPVELIVLPMNDPPVVLDIPDQTIFDYAAFKPIKLSDYVTDVDNSLDEITWAFSGQNQLTVSVNNNTATIHRKNQHFRGDENIFISAKDPHGLMGSTTATFTVLDSGLIYDLNNNGLIEIDDLIIVLQIFSGIHVENALQSGQLSFEDLLFIMNRVSN
jgi:hypothetical protein